MDSPLHFTSGRQGLRSVLGSLEAAIMEVLWVRGRSDVGEVLDALGDDHAYTTVKTVLERLTKKGLAGRERDGRAFAYTAAASRSALEARVARTVSRGLLDGFGSAALIHFVDAVREDPEQLRELRALLGRVSEGDAR